MREKARREGKEEEEGWKREWEEAVDGLVERSEGWRCVISILLSVSSRVAEARSFDVQLDDILEDDFEHAQITGDFARRARGEI